MWQIKVYAGGRISLKRSRPIHSLSVHHYSHKDIFVCASHCTLSDAVKSNKTLLFTLKTEDYNVKPIISGYTIADRINLDESTYVHVIET